jgi:hypothetical protein
MPASLAEPTPIGAAMFRLVACITLLGLLCACAAPSPKASPQPEQPAPLVPVAGASDKPSYLDSVGCVDISSLNSKNTPTEILLGSKDCLDQNDLSRSARLFGVAGVYGRFDSQRVPDVSAQEVIPAFQSALFGNVDSKTAAAFQATFKGIDESHELVEMCAQIRRLGPPMYYPTYMISHGMGAFLGPDRGLKRNFDSAAAWESALKSYLHCPPAR